MIMHDRDEVLLVLCSSEDYEPLEVAELCKQAGLWREEAFLRIKVGNVAEAVEMVLRESTNVKEVI